MKFRRRHPYLFWQIIGWAILLADFGFLVISAMEGFDDWCYPVIVFTFLAGLFIVAGTPVIIKLIKQKITPESDVNAQIQRQISRKVMEISEIRHTGAATFVAIFVMGGILVFLFAAYLLGEYVHLALGFAMLVLMVIEPFLTVIIYKSVSAKKFYVIKNGEKYINAEKPADMRDLFRENPPTLVMTGAPDTAVLNFLRNWAEPYLGGKQNLTIYRVTAQEMCSYARPREYLRYSRPLMQFSARCSYARPREYLSYDDVLLCIPLFALDLKGKEMMFRKECNSIGAFPFITYFYSETAVFDDTK